MKVSTLKKNPKNPRQISKDKLELLTRSIGSFQKMMNLRPMIVDENNVVLGGNMRLAAIKALGLKEIPDDWVKRVDDLTEDEKAEFVIKDNNAFGEYDWDAVANEWSDYPLAEWGLDVPGFESVEPEGDADAEPQIDKAAELNKKWKVKSGDLWQIGSHRLICGDSTDAGCVSRLMDGGKTQMVFTDPPYGIDYQDLQGNFEKIEGDDNLGNIYHLLSLVLENDCPMFICCNWKSFSVFETVMRERGREPKACIVWDKETRIQNLDRFYKQHEFALYHGEFGGQPTLDGDVWRCSRETRSDHPTAKPTELVQRAIKHVSDVDEIVMDYFAGSGTTLVACQNLNRKCYAIEISENYCSVILERMQTAFPDLEIKRLSESASSDESSTNGNGGSDPKSKRSKASNA